MPEIKEYSLRGEVSGPVGVRRATGEDFGAQAAEGVQQVAGKTLELTGVIHKAQTAKEISDLGAEFAKAQAELSVEYQKQLNDGTLTVDEFTQKVKDRTDEIGESASTPGARAYYTKASATINGHFLEKSAFGQAQLAGAKTKRNYAEQLNSSTITLTHDPSSFPTTLKLQMANIENLVAAGTLPAEAAEKLKIESQNDLAKAATQGWINLNPQGAKEMIEQGEWDKYYGTETVDGATVKKQMLLQADQAIHAQEVEQNRLKKQQEELKKEQQQQTQNDFLQAMVDGKLTAKDILASNLDPFGSGSKDTMLRLLEQSNNEKLKTDPAVFTDLFTRIHLPATDPKALNDENELNVYVSRGVLKLEDAIKLRKEMQDKGTQAGDIEGQLKKGLTDIAQGKLTKSNPLTRFKDPVGDANYQKWLSDFLTRYNDGKKKGLTPQQMLTPGEKEYLGNNIDNYVRSQTDVIKDTVRSLQRPGVQTTGGAAPVNVAPIEPRKPGESAAEYLKRTTGK